MKKLFFTISLAMLLALAACNSDSNYEQPSISDIGDSNYEQPPLANVGNKQPPMPNIGDTIEFGEFVWQVLDVEDNYALVVFHYILEEKPYHATFEAVTWETSDIRHYLNNSFFNTFSEAEQARIRETAVINNYNPWFGISGGNTTDRIFLLSFYEVVRYFGDSGRLADRHMEGNMEFGFTDEYASARMADGIHGMMAWWMRSPGGADYLAPFVEGYGFINIAGTHATAALGIRPALWVNMSYYG